MSGLVTIEEWKHLIPYRTQKLSTPSPMILQSFLCGKVGRRQAIFYYFKKNKNK